MSLTEQQVVEIVAVEATRLRTWVRRGWVRPAAEEGAPAFSEADVARVRLVHQLCDELGIEEETLSVVLSLLDQVHGLRAELKTLGEALDRQPEAVRLEIARVYRELSIGPEE